MYEEFVVKDSGQRQEYVSGMQRDLQEGKPRFGLIHPLSVPYADQMYTRMAIHMAKGAEKYGDRNWEKANSEEELERFIESAGRHCFQWQMGERDEDHASATMFNIGAGEYVRGVLEGKW